MAEPHHGQDLSCVFQGKSLQTFQMGMIPEVTKFGGVCWFLAEGSAVKPIESQKRSKSKRMAAIHSVDGW